MEKKRWINVPVVIAAYNRLFSLERLLTSLNLASYPHPVRLIISIDKGDNDEIIEYAKGFEWLHGEKEVITRATHLGLKRHIFFCGKLAMEYDGILLLEDDLYVSPVFYYFAMQAVEFYSNDPNIGGISLFSHHVNETAHFPFIPISDESDVFFLQIPSSWGQCWTKMQWQCFENWYNEKRKEKNDIDQLLPIDIQNWSEESSWKKEFARYLISTDRYFIYPRVSLATNFGDPGEHFNDKLFIFQVPLQLNKTTYHFKSLNSSHAVYDAFCEILPVRLSKLCPWLEAFDFKVDFYGMKPSKSLNAPYLLTTKPCREIIRSFGREFKPAEYNVIAGLAGEQIFFAKSKDCDMETVSRKSLDTESLLYYHYLREYQLKPNDKNFKVLNDTHDESYKELIRRVLIKIKGNLRNLF
jgi:hypothetical protein